MDFRLATIEDTKELLAIYAQYINTPITFEYELPTEGEFVNRIKSIQGIYPYVVCELNRKIIGYAYAHRQKEREAYKWNVELSIYIDKNFTSKGIGRKLYEKLLEILKIQEIKTVYGGVTLPNEKSEKLHYSLGFKKIGIYNNTGYKCGEWHTVVCFEKVINEYILNPKEFIEIDKISEKIIKKILK